MGESNVSVLKVIEDKHFQQQHVLLIARKVKGNY